MNFDIPAELKALQEKTRRFIAEEIIARRMTRRVIHILEVVQIDKEQGDMGAVQCGLPHGVGQQGIAQQAVGQTCQPVMLRKVGEVFL